MVDTKPFFSSLNTELANDNDRSCAIVAASIIENLLERLLKARLIPNASSKDTLFDDANSPLASLNVRIDLAHRLGFISARLASDLHKIRKIRNEFAHSFDPRSFEDGAIRDRVTDLLQTIDLSGRHPTTSKAPYDKVKGKFIMVIIFFVLTLKDLLKNSVALTGALPENEIIYTPDLVFEEDEKSTK